MVGINHCYKQDSRYVPTSQVLSKCPTKVGRVKLDDRKFEVKLLTWLALAIVIPRVDD